MLSELHIRDFAIIDDLSLELRPGFIVFTGETGAGKSIIIDAVEMLLGGRADSSMVRTDADAALIEGTFRLSPELQSAVHPILERESLLEDPDFVTLGREIRAQGRNVCRINGRTVNLSLLQEIGEFFVDVHGQSEHLSLLRVREHLHLLDRYAHVGDDVAAFTAAYGQWREIRRELAELRERERDAARQIDLLNFQINEIESAALREGELEALTAERTRLANAEQLATLARQALLALDESDPRHRTATDLLGEAAHALGALAKVDSGMQSALTEAQVLLEGTSDLARQLRRYQEQIEFSPERLDEVEERLGLIRSLERKYGNGISQVLAHAANAHAELETITHAEERLRQLERDEASALERLGELGSGLSQQRRQAADRLTTAIERELVDLRMEGAEFGVDLGWQTEESGAPVGNQRLAFNATGFDQVEFLVAPNPGEGLKSLVKIASGGETSRLMLGLKSVLAKADPTPSLIFDEIDQGIGGRVGAIVGRKLWDLARDHQVLCVTHLPQLAAFGDQHIKVEKTIEAGRTVTLARELQSAESIPELAQMLGSVSESNLESAADLLRQAAREKSTSPSG